MTIPNSDRAVVDIRKLRDYCLNPLHDEGKHKARLFATALGMAVNDAEHLCDILLQAVKRPDAKLGRRDTYLWTALHGGLLARMAWVAGHHSEWVDY